MTPRVTSSLAAFGYLMSIAVSASMAGINGPGGETAWNAAEENYQINEARRLNQIARQINLNYSMNWWSGYGPRYSSPFEPWPRIPGDIWGYPIPQPLEQPIGYQSIQTGPNRWIYRPIYVTDVAAPQNSSVDASTSPSSPIPAVRAKRPAPTDVVEPMHPAPSGPREF